MSHTNCDQDCELCPFVVDPHNPQRHVCVKCGHSYTFEPVNAISVITIIVLAVLITFGLHTEARQKRQPESLQPSSATTEFKVEPRLPVEPPSAAPSVITQAAAVELVYKWHYAISQILAPPFDRQLAAELTTDQLYWKLTRPQGRIDRLSQNNSYYKFYSQELGAVKRFEAGSDYAWIELWLTEDYAFYNHEQLSSSRSKSRTILIYYRLKRVGQQWKIAHRKVIPNPAVSPIAGISTSS